MTVTSRRVPRLRLMTSALAVAAVTVVVAAPSQAAGNVPPIPGLSPTAVAIMNSEPYTNGQWAVRVVDVATGEVLVDYNSHVLVEPASVTKTFLH